MTIKTNNDRNLSNETKNYQKEELKEIIMIDSKKISLLIRILCFHNYRNWEIFQKRAKSKIQFLIKNCFKINIFF